MVRRWTGKGGVYLARKQNTKAKYETGATLGFDEKLWAAADKMRSYMDSAEYRHVVLGLIVLKYISDAFEEKREQLALFTREGLGHGTSRGGALRHPPNPANRHVPAKR